MNAQAPIVKRRVSGSRPSDLIQHTPSVVPRGVSRRRNTDGDRVYTEEDLLILEQLAIHQARESFWAYRLYMRPLMKRGWFQHDLALQLQQFYLDMKAGLRPKLVLEAPPQHGKSDTVIDFVAWVAGKEGEWSTIYASFSDRLGVRANLRTQRAMDSDKYKKVFDTRLASGSEGTYTRNRDLLEYVDTRGSFRNTTVMGSVTGESLDLGVIDDPIKGRKEANSPTVRNSTWNWLMDDFFTRFAEHAGLLIILTRWHLDDPVGRLLESDPTVKVLRYPAIAEKDELGRDGKMRRLKGEPLFAELKSLAFLLIRKGLMTIASWMAIYQQSPIVTGGELFPVDNFVLVDRLPAGAKIKRSVRYWDKAGTKDGGAYTAGVLMHELVDGRWFIADVKRGQLRSFDRETLILATARNDGTDVSVYVEQEPGSGGKESAERSVAMLAGFKAYMDKVTGDKVTRADPYAAQVQGGNILLQAAAWNKKFLDEHEFFPNGPYKDQVDAAGGAFAKLTAVTKGRVGVLF